MSKIKLLVLGGNGFIGRNILAHFTPLDDYDVLAPRRHELNLLDAGDVSAYMAIHRPDVVVHSAVNIQALDENLRMYFNIDRCSGDYGKLITIGSGAEYDMRHYHPMMKESFFRTHIPADTYGLSKFAAASDIERSGKRAVNLRGFGIYGRHEDYRRRFISNNICRVLCGFDISLSQNMRFDFLYVNDLMRILESFIAREPLHRSYNICTSQPHELLKLAEMVRSVHGNPHIGLSVRESGEKPEYSGDNTRFLDEFGPFTFTDMLESIRELYAWYSDNVEISDYCRQLREAARSA
ncbi:MAG: NAD(P)-dependent oxidoreductase [Lamprobacter sp.]|uniref:NAD-dependent epimerase/dehydratase family protein n=1 Tax=Lamprobacter sp. TaxID=3100796 RepID=UPI002B264322|nr:NAD(P)-dependent oxidoreductase [Lamprobacter sp.]MEA3641486.1 NAD(P)-dependent oxidoreductase [Lamprobacter sp.]